MLPTITHGPTVITLTTHRIKRGRQHSMRREHSSIQQSNLFLATSVAKKLDHYIRRRLMKMELKLHSRARSGTSTASSIKRMPITGKKQQLIRDIQLFWDGLPKKKISLMCRKYGIAMLTLKKYISMTDEEINGMDVPKSYKTRKRAGNDFVNIIYKMTADRYDDEIIYQYLRKSGVSNSRSNLCDYIQAISKENFPDRKRMYGMRLMDQRYPDDVIVIRRNELLKHILTIDSKKKRIRSFLKIWISFRRSSQRSHGLQMHSMSFTRY